MRCAGLRDDAECHRASVSKSGIPLGSTACQASSAAYNALVDISKLLFPKYSSTKRRQQMQLLRVALWLGLLICLVLIAMLYLINKDIRFESLWRF